MLILQLWSTTVLAASVSIARPAAAAPQAWSDFHRNEFRAFLGFSDVPPDYPLMRVLEASGWTPAAAVKVPEETRPAAARAAIEQYAHRLLEDFQAKEIGQRRVSDRLVFLRDEVNRLGDVENLSGWISKEVSRRVASRRDGASAALAEEGSRLVSEAITGGAAGWKQGRTRLVPLPDGSVLAFKSGHDWDSLAAETRRMNEAAAAGLDAPVPLQPQSGDVLPYFLPEKLAANYNAYLNEKLPRELSRADRVHVIRAAALKAVDDMVKLRRAGLAHESLTAVSHSKVHWEWDYWRLVQPWLGWMRWGPSSIHNWKQGLAFPNLRLSGLADFEHLNSFDTFDSEEKRRQGAYQGGIQLVAFHRHDAYSYAAGQNLTEWALVVLHAARVNRLAYQETAAIVWEGLERYAPGVSWSDTEVRSLQKAIVATSRRFRWTRLFTGNALQPFIMRAMKPYIQRLREKGVLDMNSYGKHPVTGPARDETIAMMVIGWFLGFCWTGLAGSLLFYYERAVLGKTVSDVSFGIGVLIIMMGTFPIMTFQVLLREARRAYRRASRSFLR